MNIFDGKKESAISTSAPSLDRASGMLTDSRSMLRPPRSDSQPYAVCNDNSCCFTSKGVPPFEASVMHDKRYLVQEFPH